ncbi:MAG TPA: hypothetical protein VHE12_03695 [bacterium]|nr:hypothetical protein [bacterium]
MKCWIYWMSILSVGVWAGACSPTFNPTDPIPVTVSPTPTGTLVPSGFTLTKFQSASNLSSGQTIFYVLSYSEPSTAVAPNLALWDTVPTGVQFLQVYPGPGNPPQFTQNGNVLIWGYPGPVTGLSGAITWSGAVSCSSGAITNTASLQTQNSFVTYSNQVVAFVSCNTDTPTPTPSQGTTLTPTITSTIPISMTATWTPSPTGTVPATWTDTYTPTASVSVTSTLTPPVTVTTTTTGTPSPTGTSGVTYTFTLTPTQPVTWTATYTPSVSVSVTGTATVPVTVTTTHTWTPTPSMTFSPTVSATITPTPFVTCTAPVTWGDWNGTASPVTILYGTSCQKYTLTQATQVNNIDFVTASVGGSAYMAVGIYADGGGYPGALIWNSSFQTFTPSGSAYGFTVPSIDLAAGTYWLAVVGDGTTTLEKAVGSTSTRYWRNGVVFPDPFMSPGGPLPTPINTPPPNSTTDIADLWSLGCQ